MKSPDMNISRRREAIFFAENGSETVENDQTGLPSWAEALRAQKRNANNFRGTTGRPGPGPGPPGGSAELKPLNFNLT